MRPIGTITQYFPFIDEDTKTVLERVMKEAEDYYDFVLKLCDLVLNNDSPELVVFFAIRHATMAFEFKTINKIREKYNHHQLLGPFFYYASMYHDDYEDSKKAQEFADEVLASNPEEWIQLELNLLKFEVDMRNYPETMYKTSNLDKVYELMNSNPIFGFYESMIFNDLEVRASVDGDSDERMRCLRKALDVAEKFDDVVAIAGAEIRIANIIMNYDRTEAKHLFRQSLTLVDSLLGIPNYYANIVYFLAILDAIRGDFDSAIKLCLEAVTVRERAGLSSANPSYFLSTFYNIIGDPESALEWGQMAEDQFRINPVTMNRARLNQVWSLALLGRISEAQLLLDDIQKEVIHSGAESQLAWLHFATGILEREQGELDLAISSMEQGLKIYEQQGTALIMELIFLYQLAITEVLSCNDGDIISPSLAILEEKAITEDLPGILGQVLLLKANIAIQNNEDAVLREIIPQLRSIIEEDNIFFLKPYYEQLHERL